MSSSRRFARKDKMATILFIRRALRRERVLRDRSQPLDHLDDCDLISRYRFPRRILLELIDVVDLQLHPATERSHAIPTQIQVLCTLRFLAKGDFFSEVGDIHGISKASMSVLLPKLCRVLCLHLNNIKFPSSQQTLQEIKQKFYNIAGFPNVIGAIDGTLIPIRAVGGDEEHIYVSRKGFHALNIQGVVDADMRFLSINCRFPGCTHDAYILSNSNLGNNLENLNHGGWLLGDSAYPLKSFLMTPFLNPSTPKEINYNNAHCKTRNVVERAFGVLKSRFRCLHISGGCIPFKPEKCSLIIETCLRLHNKAVIERVPLQQGGRVTVYHNEFEFVNDGRATQTARYMRQQIADRF